VSVPELGQPILFLIVPQVYPIGTIQQLLPFFCLDNDTNGDEANDPVLQETSHPNVGSECQEGITVENTTI
jgi:hypothetical protein